MNENDNDFPPYPAGCTTINIRLLCMHALPQSLWGRAFCHSVKICWLLIGGIDKVKCFCVVFFFNICLSVKKINGILF